MGETLYRAAGIVTLMVVRVVRFYSVFGGCKSGRLGGFPWARDVSRPFLGLSFSRHSTLL